MVEVSVKLRENMATSNINKMIKMRQDHPNGKF